MSTYGSHEGVCLPCHAEKNVDLSLLTLVVRPAFLTLRSNFDASAVIQAGRQGELRTDVAELVKADLA